jgi:transcriptional regulator with XRE-family HTH domain
MSENNMNESFHDRLWRVAPRDIPRYNDTAYARYLKIPREQLSRWKHKRTTPTLTTIERLADILDCEPGWLAWGEVEVNKLFRSNGI